MGVLIRDRALGAWEVGDRALGAWGVGDVAAVRWCALWSLPAVSIGKISKERVPTPVLR